MQARTYGWALLLSDDDHRRQTVEQKLAKLKEFKLPSTRVVETVGPFQLVFGHQPYHIFLKLEADSPEALLEAFAALEEGFSHVDGFI